MFKKIRQFFINRSFTNIVRYIIDNLLPPVIRDSRCFMYPFYCFVFKGKNIRENMNFKSKLYQITGKELEKIYQDYDTIGTERFTDLNRKSLKYIINNLHSESKTVLDVGCGNGYLLKELKKAGYQAAGVDVFDSMEDPGFEYIKAGAEKLPFSDSSFDTVISTHTLEHIIDIRKAAEELKRVAAKQVISVVPCQRFNYYTLDHHLHFFPRKEMLEGLMDMQKHTIRKIGGDWVYTGYVEIKV
ncbi:MAG: class I SAM-dependent methyltransferase [Bacteroidales bacterium]|nr:class I SAM-dependent methyltransferase [Bacteroidales bacterium]